MKTLPIVLATVLTSSLVGTTHAAPAEEIRQRVVNFADLDLSQNPGAEELYRRITSAAREVCGTPGLLQLVKTFRTRHCAEEATARAVADVNAPVLTRYYAERTGTDDDSGMRRTALVQRASESNE